MKIVVIGFLGSMRAYVNLSREDAIKRYDAENPDYTVEVNGVMVEELEVKDSFSVYDIWVDKCYD